MAKSYSCRPSELVGVEEPYESWCLDEVTYTWGSSVDNAVERARVDGEDKDDPEAGPRAAKAELERLLSDPRDERPEQEQPHPATVKGRFRDPAADFAAARARRRPQ